MQTYPAVILLCFCLVPFQAEGQYTLAKARTALAGWEGRVVQTQQEWDRANQAFQEAQELYLPVRDRLEILLARRRLVQSYSDVCHLELQIARLTRTGWHLAIDFANAEDALERAVQNLVTATKTVAAIRSFIRAKGQAPEAPAPTPIALLLFPKKT